MSDPRLQDIPQLWSAKALTRPTATGIQTGFSALNEAIGGWPTPALIELLIDEYGIGELHLLTPLMRAIQQRQNASAPRIVLWLNPPFEIQATALLQDRLEPGLHWVTTQPLKAIDVLWAAEHALRSGACSLVIAWASRTDLKSLRRLKLAALTGTTCILFRPRAEQATASPATLRMVLSPHRAGLAINIIKLAGQRPCELVIEVSGRTSTISEDAPS